MWGIWGDVGWESGKTQSPQNNQIPHLIDGSWSREIGTNSGARRNNSLLAAQTSLTTKLFSPRFC